MHSPAGQQTAGEKERYPGVLCDRKYNCAGSVASICGERLEIRLE